MAINVPGLISMILFYLAVLLMGIWASRKKRKGANDAEKTEEAILAGRSIGLFIAIFTMTATWVGGGFINGSAEAVYTDGLVWCQASIGYSCSLLLAGRFFAKPMRDRGYITMLDPMQEKFGNRVGGLLFFPSFLGELLWCSSILAALGSTMSVILGLPFSLCVIISSSIAVFYTLLGGLYAVAYTDVVQLVCVFFGLWLCVPFAMTHEAVSSIDIRFHNWLGEVDVKHAGSFVDTYLLLIFGGIPWQAYFQRVLATKSAKIAQISSACAALGCMILITPAILIGAIGRVTDWPNTGYGKELAIGDANKILPLVLQYLTPPAVSFFGLGAISAAVMSSADSTVLSVSSMFTRNVYKLALRPKASDRELLWVMKGAILANGAVATAVALTAKSIYKLFVMTGDVVYVALFPQLLGVIHFPNLVNSYGSLFGLIFGLIMRILCGEKGINLPATIKLPYYQEDGTQLFPYRTFSMVMCSLSILIFTYVSKKLFATGFLSKDYDFLNAFSEEKKKLENVDESKSDVNSEKKEDDVELKAYNKIEMTKC